MLAPTVRVTKVVRQTKTSWGIEINGAESLGVPSRKRIVVSGKKREAELYASKVQTDLSNGKLGILQAPASPVRLNDLITHHIESKKNYLRSSSSKRYYNLRDGLMKFVNAFLPEVAKDAGKLTPPLIQEFMTEAMTSRKKSTFNLSWAPKTVNECLTLMKGVFATGIKDNLVISNPFEKVELLPVPKKGGLEFFSREEVKKILETIDPFWRDVILFLLLTGIRKGELINLKHPNVRLNTDSPYIEITGDDEWVTKGGRSRVIHLVPEAVRIIKERQNRNDTYVFTGATNEKIKPDEPYHALVKALQTLGLTGDIHKLRHTFSASFLAAGNSLYELKEVLGHASIDTTMVYAHL